MSTKIAFILESTSVHVVRADAPTKAHTVAWSPDAPDVMVNAIREHVGERVTIALVVGLGLLEIAEPDLPPLASDERRALLLRDADRYFPLDESVAVSSANRVAFAVSARQLHTWIRAIERVGTVSCVVTAPQVAAAALASKSGVHAALLPAGEGERGVVQLRSGVIESVRRIPSSAVEFEKAANSTQVDAPTIGTAALQWDRAPIHAQLLDDALARSMVGARQRRWLISASAFAASVALLLWSGEVRRERTLTSLEDRARSLEDSAAPALRADARATRAASELTLLRSALDARESSDAANVVLAHLTRVLPRDAFVQRLEWDGSVWRVDGTADNAPKLVPLLDADTHFRDVRIVASSQRFLDLGRQRETFAISFRTRDADGARAKTSGAASNASGGVNGAP